MTLPADFTRCLGGSADQRCERAAQCARSVAQRHDAPEADRSWMDRLCYSGTSFFIDRRPPMDQPRYRDPATLTAERVCPHCKQRTEVFLVSCDGHVLETHRCVWHGDVVPMRSAVVNASPGSEWPDWSAA